MTDRDKMIIENTQKLMDAIIKLHPVFDMSNPLHEKCYMAYHNCKKIIESALESSPEQKPNAMRLERDLANIYEVFLREQQFKSDAPEIKLLHSLYAKIVNRVILEPEEQKPTDEIKDINFLKWYSGMEESKIRSAHKRYLKEMGKTLQSTQN